MQRSAKRHSAHASARQGENTLIPEPLEPRTLFAATTNDPYLASQYALSSGGITDAWSTTTGSAATVIAGIDSGIDYTHHDLYANIWINQAEIPSAIRSKLTDADRDGRISFWDLNHAANRPLMTDVNRNGYIDGGDLLSPVSQGGWEDGINGKSNANDKYADDILGWDFAENDNDPFDDGFANGGHGTHTAGIMGAMGNNGTGISGAAQRVSMIAVRIFADNGYSASTARIAEAIRYSADSGARVANASWGGGSGYNGDAIHTAIKYAGTKGQLFVTAAGNSGQNLDSAWANNWPAEYALDNVIVVSATTSTGSLASWSNYGASTVDVAAPGSSILSTTPGNRYQYMSGTSMAAPLVTGTAALMLAANPSLTTSQLKQRLIDGADETSTLYSRSVSKGKLSASNALAARAGASIATPTPTPTATPVIRGVRYFWAYSGRSYLSSTADSPNNDDSSGGTNASSRVASM